MTNFLNIALSLLLAFWAFEAVLFLVSYRQTKINEESATANQPL